MSVRESRKKILIISHDKIGENMAGPGIRYHYMAVTLSKWFDITVGFFDPSYLPRDDFVKPYLVTHIDKGVFQESFRTQDAIISMWLSEEMMLFCQKLGIYTVFDAYAPVPVENLALFLYNGDPITPDVDYSYRQSYNLYEKFFQFGDLFLFSNRRQLDFWMGYVFGSGSISVSGYKKRPVFERFIYAPMGIDASQEPKKTAPAIRDVIPEIKKNDKVILWTGGIWNWFDAKTLIKAMQQLKNTRPDIKLVFFGTKHPNPDVPAMKEAADTLQLAKDLGLHGSTVFIHEGWVPYGERLNYLLEADAAVNTTKDTIESEMAHRTRVLDHILVELPTVATSGDYLSDDVIEQDEIGIKVPPEDVEALTDAIIKVVDRKQNAVFRKNIKTVKHRYSWEESLRPLVDNLRDNMVKLSYVEVKKPREMPKNVLSYKIAKKILPRPLKSLIVRILRYGR